MKNTYFEKAIELTETIETKSNELIDLTESLESNKSDLDVRKAEILAEVAAAVDPESGKAKFTNEAARSAELAIRSQEDDLLGSCRENFNGQNAKRIRLTNEIEKLKNQLSIYKAFAAVLAN